LRKRERCSPKVNAWVQTIPTKQDFLSVIVMGELIRGVKPKSRKDPVAGMAIEKWLIGLTHVYEGRILPITMEIATAWDQLSALRPIPPEDGLQAATALVHGLTLATRNIKNVVGLGVQLVNPWD
jgi:predicted nucleic acid-binding protein